MHQTVQARRKTCPSSEVCECVCVTVVYILLITAVFFPPTPHSSFPLLPPQASISSSSTVYIHTMYIYVVCVPCVFSHTVSTLPPLLILLSSTSLPLPIVSSSFSEFFQQSFLPYMYTYTLVFFLSNPSPLPFHPSLSPCNLSLQSS